MANANIHMFFALDLCVQVSVAGFLVLRCSPLLSRQLRQLENLSVCEELTEGQWRIVAVQVTSILIVRQVASSWC